MDVVNDRGEHHRLYRCDDPRSIARCTNKIFLAEAAERFGLPVPRTVIIGQDDPAVVVETVGLPCVIKIPDSSFSRGVIKVESADELAASIERLHRCPPDTLVLPSHGRPFHGLHARLDDLQAHHRQQLDVLCDACVEPRTAFEVLPSLFRASLVIRSSL